MVKKEKKDKKDKFMSFNSKDFKGFTFRSGPVKIKPNKTLHFGILILMMWMLMSF